MGLGNDCELPDPLSPENVLPQVGWFASINPVILIWFCRPLGSDCGLVNVNIPTSGAEIGGAFGKS